MIYGEREENRRRYRSRRRAGAAVANRLSRSGFGVAALDIAEHIPGDFALSIGAVDLGDPESASNAFSQISERLGRLDGLVNIAGGFRWETIEQGSIETWDLLYKLNLRTAVVATMAALPLLSVRGGSIVNISAAASAKADEGMGAYAASKSGVSRFTEALAAEFKGRNIRANAILPRIIDTPKNRADIPDADFTTWVTPDELARIVQFFLMDELGSYKWCSYSG